MSRSVPPLLAAYMAGNSTELCAIVKIGPLPDDSYRYLSGLDRDVPYDDGDGESTYRASTGMQVSAFVSSSDLGVDNAEMDTLPVVMGNELHGFTAEQIKSGELDAVPYVVYVVCFTNTALGHFIWSGGPLGEARIKGSAFFNLEHRSITNKLKQTVGESDSVDCRAPFGSQPIGTVGAERTHQYPCGYDYTADWVPFVVSAAHPTDSDLVFYTSDFAQASNYFRHGMVRMLTGANAGQQREVESNVLDTGEQTVTLKYPFPRPISELDEAEIRWGCDKTPGASTGCRRFFDTNWVFHYRGEPYQPSGDASINLMGGAGIPGDVGGTGENPTGPTIPPVPPPSGGAGTPGTPTARTIGATVIDPADAPYNADETGATDATTAFNNAIAALPGDGGIIRPSAGTYLIDPDVGIQLVSNVRLDLETNNVTLRASHTNDPSAPADHKDVVSISGTMDNVEVVGGRITGYLDTWITGGATGAYGVSEWAHGIFIGSGATQVTVKNTTISKCVGDAISIGFSGNDIWVDNCVLTNCRRQGVSNGGDNVKITNNEISYIGTTYGTLPKAGIDNEPDDPATSVTVEFSNNWIHHCAGPGILVWLDTSGITIDGNTLEYNQRGLQCHDGDSGTFTNNIVRHNKNEGAKWESDSDGWTVSGNEFFNNKTSLRGVITTGNSTTMTGTSSATSDHIYITSDSSPVSVGTNEYGPT